VIDNGYARTMTAWLIHRDASIRVELSKVMPGAVWKTWEPQHGTVTQGAVAGAAAQIADYLQGLPPETTKVSTRAVKRAMPGLAAVPKMTFTPGGGGSPPGGGGNPAGGGNPPGGGGNPPGGGGNPPGGPAGGSGSNDPGTGNGNQGNGGVDNGKGNSGDPGNGRGNNPGH
jgi:hypothetical protein